jgi:conjugative transposon TraK protein
MFQQFKNIDTAFQFIRVFAIAFLVSNVAICIYTVHRSTMALQIGQQRIYVLYEGKLAEANAVERKDSMAVEIRDHVKMFHYYFYSLIPDDAYNNRHIEKALNLADSCASQEHKSLVESGYYLRIISNNISQEVQEYDSIYVDNSHEPYYFRYYGKLKITRPTSVATRSLISEGYIRMLHSVSDNNPHGMLIERWKVIDNRDLSIEKR